MFYRNKTYLILDRLFFDEQEGKRLHINFEF
jgi:hypothetical protein